MTSIFNVADTRAGARDKGEDQTVTPGRRLQGFLLLPVTWVILGILVIAPTAYVVIASVLKDPTNLASGISFASIVDVFATPVMLLKLAETILFAIVVAAITTVIATALAWTTTRLELRGAKLREPLIIASLFLSPFVTAVAWVWLATKDTGLIDRAMQSVHIPTFLQPSILSVGGMVFVLVTHYVPYAYMFISSSMRGLDSTLEEASLVNGRNIFFTSMRISIPMLRPAILSAGLFVAILTVGEFTVPSILGQTGAFTPLSVYVYNSLNGAVQNIPLGATISTELLVVCLVGLYLYQRSIRATSRYVSVSGKGRGSGKIRVRPLAATLVWAGTIVYVLLAFIVPVATLLLMSMSKFLPTSLTDIQLSFSNLWDIINTAAIRQATLNSLILAIAVSIVCIALGVLIVYLSDRLRLRSTAAMAYIATAPMALPGLVMGLGVLLLFIRTPLYLTLPLIGIGLVGISLTHSVRLISNGFRQIDASLEEASQVSGASRLRTVIFVLLPLIRPSLYAAFSLIFVLSLRELNVPIMLYSPNSETLSVVAWNFSSSAVTSAAAVGLLQVVIMFIGMGVLRLVINPERRSRS